MNTRQVDGPRLETFTSRVTFKRAAVPPHTRRRRELAGAPGRWTHAGLNSRLPAKPLGRSAGVPGRSRARQRRPPRGTRPPGSAGRGGAERSAAGRRLPSAGGKLLPPPGRQRAAGPAESSRCRRRRRCRRTPWPPAGSGAAVRGGARRPPRLPPRGCRDVYGPGRSSRGRRGGRGRCGCPSRPPGAPLGARGWLRPGPAPEKPGRRGGWFRAPAPGEGGARLPGERGGAGPGPGAGDPGGSRRPRPLSWRRSPPRRSVRASARSPASSHWSPGLSLAVPLGAAAAAPPAAGGGSGVGLRARNFLRRAEGAAWPRPALAVPAPRYEGIAACPAPRGLRGRAGRCGGGWGSGSLRARPPPSRDERAAGGPARRRRLATSARLRPPVRPGRRAARRRPPCLCRWLGSAS